MQVYHRYANQFPHPATDELPLTVQPDTPFRNGALLFCSDACATGHPNAEPCHAACGGECPG